MNPNDYRPAPIDTSVVRLPRELDDLTEKLAANTHEIWAQQRMKDGWRCGAHRDDTRKLHPCLVPYDQLPESEKVYDRRTAMETLKGILALGFHITR
jgi:ryanodine receptor 2